VHLQQKGICHRDLSLENILLEDDNNLVLIDFGLALRVPYKDNSNVGGVADVSEGTNRLLMKAQGQSGTLKYLAPEIIEREDFDGFAADLWSAGVLLFVFLVGLAPFQLPSCADFRYAHINKGNLKELMAANLQEPVSDEACDLLQNMLWRDPRKRLTLAQVLQHPWVVAPPQVTLGADSVLQPKTENILSRKEQTVSAPKKGASPKVSPPKRVCTATRLAL
jgi:serine/threonine protein kinase